MIISFLSEVIKAFSIKIYDMTIIHGLKLNFRKYFESPKYFSENIFSE